MHSSYKFSVTIRSDDLATVNCLRALSQYSQRTGNNRIPWGGTKDDDWRRAGNQVTFRFTSQAYRLSFMNEAKRLLRSDTWEIAGLSDDDPAKPQN